MVREYAGDTDSSFDEDDGRAYAARERVRSKRERVSNRMFAGLFGTILVGGAISLPYVQHRYDSATIIGEASSAKQSLGKAYDTAVRRPSAASRDELMATYDTYLVATDNAGGTSKIESFETQSLMKGLGLLLSPIFAGAPFIVRWARRRERALDEELMALEAKERSDILK